MNNEFAVDITDAELRKKLHDTIDILIDAGYDNILVNCEDFNIVSLHWCKTEFGTYFEEVGNS